MTPAGLLRRSLTFYWRTHLGVLLGSAVATAVLVGALAVGDSVRHSLLRLAMGRLGDVGVAMSAGDRFFTGQLADRLADRLGVTVAPALIVPGTAAAVDGVARAGNVQIVGADERFWSLAPAGGPPPGGPDSVVINARLARRLRCQVGQEIVLRVERPPLLPREAPLSVADDASVAARLTVVRIAPGDELGDFSLAANQLPPYNAFVLLSSLQRRIGLPGQANTLLVSSGPEPDKAAEALRECWSLGDAGLELRELEGRKLLELRSRRVFIDAPVAAAARRAGLRSCGVLTYFVNELRLGRRTAPYSFVAALGSLDAGGQPPGPIPADMADDEIIINDWLAEDLKAAAGDRIELRYFVLGPMRQLTERTSRFTVRQVVLIDPAAAGRELMPLYPGLADVKNCRDWRPGVPIDLGRIRDKDQQYWQQYGGTPKAFITLAAGRKIWANRFGDLTAVRYRQAENTKEQVASRILAELDPAAVGLFFAPVRRQALAASGSGLDFGQLFVGLSFFLIVAGLLLMALLLALGADQRRGEVGLLLAVGLRAGAVRRLLLAEGGTLALAGSIVGSGAGLAYTRAVLFGLATVWSPAVAGTGLRFYVEPGTVLAGAAAGLAAGLAAMWLVLRTQAGTPARQLLALAPGEMAASPAGGMRRRISLAAAVMTAAAAAGIVLFAGTGRHKAAVGAFFAAGGLLLIAGLAGCYYILTVVAPGRAVVKMTSCGLAIRNCARRRGRSLAVVALVACGSFLIVAVGANRQDPRTGAEARGSGTGGFALVGRSALPVYHDLNSASGQDALGLTRADMAGATAIQLRVREGDDASCLNLNRAQLPRLLGVRPGELDRRGAFTFVSTVEGADRSRPWLLLADDGEADVVPAVGDDATVTWGLDKKVGQTLDYVDDSGRPFRIRIVGIIASSIFQGSLLVSEQALMARFGSAGGYREFLIDAPPGRAPAVSTALERSLVDAGLELTPAGDRLATFKTVENTYLSIFQALGGLGMLLGSIAVAVLAARNILERRNELAMMRAVGFTKARLRWLVFLEHCGLLALGLVCGTVAAVAAVLPALRGSHYVPYTSLAITLLAVALSAAVFVYAAAAAALGGPLLTALRNE